MLEGIVTQATEVDHVFPWRQIDESAFFRNIFQGLCKEHHATKTALERRGIVKHYTDKVQTYRVADYQRILAELDQ